MENNNLSEMYNNLRSGFGGLEGVIGGHRETIPPVAQQYPPPPNQQQQYQGQPPPPQQGNPIQQGFQQAQNWGMNYANPYFGNGWGQMPPQPQQPYANPFGSPFVAPRVNMSDDMLEYHAKLRVKLLKIKNKMMFTIPKQVLKSYFDRKDDKVLIADFYRSGQKKTDIVVESPIYKAFERQDKVAQLDKIADDRDLEEMEEFMEFISIEEFKLARENGTLKLPTLEEFNGSIQKIMLIDFADFVIYGIKEATGDISVSAQELVGNLKNKFMGG